jgi:V8-like Glu-specific endopeptidase
MKILHIFLLTLLGYAQAQMAIIGGHEIDPTTRPEIVQLLNPRPWCSAVIVGPKVLLTAAHCVKGKNISFKQNGVTYKVTLTRHPKYPGKDYDVAAGLLDAEIPIKTATIGGSVQVGDMIDSYGYGCTQAGGSGYLNELWEGTSKVTGFTKYDIVSSGPAALCYGDSGGPTFFQGLLIGINSKGNIKNKSWFANLSLQENISFLQNWANKNGVIINGL